MTGLCRASMIVVAALALACATAGAPSDPEPTPTSGAGGSASSATSPSTAGSPTSSEPIEAVSLRAQTLAAPVAVVSLAAAEASVCEQMCGRVGDCLGDRGPSEATHFELGCLDLCVNVSEDSDEARSFRGCMQRDACGSLIECVSSNWDATAMTRVEFDTLVDGVATDTCELYCRGIYGCMYYNQTLSQGVDFPPDTEREIESCVQVCDPADGSVIDLATCSREPTCDDYWTCYDTAQQARFP